MELSSEVVERARARVGATLGGRYRLEALLGVGGMGAVFAARGPDGSGVAVKLLHKELSHVPVLAARFVREAYVANHLAHPGVPRVIEHGTDGERGAPFIAMELLEGETLEARWERCGKRLPMSEVLACSAAALDVLAAAHAKDVVHRDIKPENLFLTTQAELKVLDFGIARMRDGASATASGELMGTPAFMPPEQAGGHSKTVDGRADVWAIGAVMFTLMSGHEVHEARTATQQLVYAATQKARSLATVAPEVPASVVALVDRALAFDRDARWGSAAEMFAVVDAAAQAFPLERQSVVEQAPTVPTVTASGRGATIPYGKMTIPGAKLREP